MKLDTSNKFLIGAQGEAVVILGQCKRLSKDDALNLAAWLVAIADPSREKFDALHNAIINT